MYFSYPYYPSQFNAGLQPVNWGVGGSLPHIEQSTINQVWPTAYHVPTMGLGAMPRQWLGPTPVVNVNQYAGMTNNLQINGLQKPGS